jgi:flagellar basal-body rod protein FlgB
MSLLDTTQLALEAAMRGSMLRQTLLTNNLANAISNGQSPTSVNFSPATQAGAVGADGNGVSGEQDSAQLAENGLLYEDLTAVAAQRESILKTAMGAPGS